MGSYARDEQNEESDIDFIVEFNEADYGKVAGLMIYLENEFTTKIDIVINGKSLSEKFKELNKKDTMYA